MSPQWCWESASPLKETVRRNWGLVVSVKKKCQGQWSPEVPGLGGILTVDDPSAVFAPVIYSLVNFVRF